MLRPPLLLILSIAAAGCVTPSATDPRDAGGSSAADSGPATGDAGTLSGDAGTPDSGTPDGGAPDASMPSPDAGPSELPLPTSVGSGPPCPTPEQQPIGAGWPEVFVGSEACDDQGPGTRMQPLCTFGRAFERLPSAPGIITALPGDYRLAAGHQFRSPSEPDFEGRTARAWLKVGFCELEVAATPPLARATFQALVKRVAKQLGPTDED